MSSGSPPVLPPIEDLFILEVIDFNLKHNATQPFFTFADPAAPNGVQVITHLEFGRAAHRIAHILRPNRLGADGQVVGIIALSDTILYQAIVAGCVVAGFVPFPISPRNSADAIVNLLEKTSCRRLITTNVTLESLIEDVRARLVSTNQLPIEEVPSLADSFPYLGHELPEHPFERFSSAKIRPSKDDICIYLHSSGSTGFPKAIPQTHSALIHWALFRTSVSSSGDHRPRLVLGSMALPAFHTLGIYVQLLNPLYGITSVTVYPPTATAPSLLPITPSPTNILEHAELTRSTALISIPTLLQIWSASPKAIEFLATLHHVGYSGGPLAPKLGDLLVRAGVRLHAGYGGTEFGAPTDPILRKGDESDWEYMRFHDRAKIRWVPQGDGTFELQLLAWDKHQPMVLNLPDVEGYATSDLWVNHPTKKDLWKIVGRIDDVIVHSSGEKTVPAPMENIIMSSPLVQDALMFGRGRDQTGIIIEPQPGSAINVENDEQLSVLRNKLWPIIEEANKVAPAFSRIFKEMILVTSIEKPLPRAAKGTVMRKAALRLYDEEITTLYQTVESNIKRAGDAAPPDSWSLSDVQTWLVNQASDLVLGGVVSTGTDLFDQGFDSLSATFLRLRIIGVLRSSTIESVQNAAQSLTQNLIYSYPVIRDLAAHLVSLFTSPEEVPSLASGTSRIEDMIKKYSIGLDGPGTLSRSVPTRTTPFVVLLTGSTGSLGSEVLDRLLRDPRVDHIYAFNRLSKESATQEERHFKTFQERGLKVDLLRTGRVTFISGDATQSSLGLDRGQYHQLSSSVDLVIHNAWRLDFNLSLSAFEPNIQGTRHLIDLLKSGPNAAAARFVFTSSIASAQSWPQSKGPYPEEFVTDSSFAVGGGYGEGKYVAERILVNSGLNITSLRIGQISGGLPNGSWAITDWVPILVKSSIKLGMLPDIQGVVSWIQMDSAAALVVDSALGTTVSHQAVNVVHPQPVEGTKLIRHMQNAIIEVLGRYLALVSIDKWLETIEQYAESATETTLTEIPAIKLLSFFRSLKRGNDQVVFDNEFGELAGFSTEKILQVSDTVMRELRPIGSDDALMWLKYWRSVGFV